MKIAAWVASTIVALIIIILGINYFTVYPTMYFLRYVSSRDKNFGNIGPYETDISLVSKKRTILIEDDYLYDPLPDNTVTLYGLNEEKGTQPLIFFIHGGGWSLGDESQLANYTKLLASNGYLVASANYALAPEYPYPTSTRQLMHSLNHLYENAEKYQIDKENIFIMGNSAGAHLTAQLAALLNDEAYAHQVNVKPTVPKESIKGVILYNGVYDFKATEKTRFPFFDKFAWSYTQKKDYLKSDKLDEISPINYINKDFPNTFITAGNTDPLLDQTILMSEALKKENVSVEEVLWSDDSLDLNHDYMFHLNTQEAVQIYEAVLAFMDKHLEK